MLYIQKKIIFGKTLTLLSNLLRKSIYLFFFSFIVASNLVAQDIRDNFSYGNVFDLKKDNSGRIWLATNTGVYVSDGVNYIQINLGDYQTTNSSIKELYLENEKIFLIFKDSGLMELNSLNLSYSKVTNKPVVSFFIEDHNKAFILTKNASIYSYEIGAKSKIDLKLLVQYANDRDNEPKMTFYSKDYLLISFTNKGIFKINKKKWVIEKKYNIEPDGFNNRFIHLNDRLFFINKLQLYEIDKNDQFVKSNYIKNNENISFLLPISDTEKIIVKSRKKLYLENDDELVQFNLSKTKNYEINTAIYLSPNSIIFGTNQGVIKVLNIDKKAISFLDTAVQSPEYINIRRKIIPYNKDELLLFGFPKSHLYNLKTNQFTALTNSIVPIYDAILIGKTVYATSEGGGVKKIDLNNKILNNIVTKDIDTVKLYKAITSIDYLIKDHLFIGRRGAVILYNYKKNTSSVISLNNSNAVVKTILLDSIAKIVYIGTSSGLYTYNHTTKTLYKKVNINGVDISDIAILRKNGNSSLWYISENGAAELDLKTNKIIELFNLSKFDNAKLTTILIDNHNKVWISSYNGVYFLNNQYNKFIKFNSKDGLVNQEYNFKSAAKLNNGQLIFGGLNGYDIISADLFNLSSKELKGKVMGYSFYSSKGIKYENYIKSKLIEYNTNNYYLELYFSMEQLEKFKSCSFEYKIDDRPWIPLLGTSYLYMYNLNDGMHRIYIRGVDEVGNLINFDTINVNQYTNFFDSVKLKYILFIFVIILISATSFILYYNNKRINKIKSDIAMDLHDDIGTVLTRALFIINDDAVLKKNANLINYISEALYSIRTYINTFTYEKINIIQVFDDIIEQSRIFFNKSNIEFKFINNLTKNLEISNYKYRDLKLIIYEINQNILKHSNAKNVIYTISQIENQLFILIKDDGIIKSTKNLENKGNGITNIRKRVNRIKGFIDFNINPEGNGLLIQIELNLINN